VAEPGRGLERVGNQCSSRIEEQGHDTSTETRQLENILRDAARRCCTNRNGMVPAAQLRVCEERWRTDQGDAFDVDLVDYH
jgi:hypothetical protein